MHLFFSHTDQVSGGLMRGNAWHIEIDLFELIASHPISSTPSVPNCVWESFQSFKGCIEQKVEKRLKMRSGAKGSISARLSPRSSIWYISLFPPLLFRYKRNHLKAPPLWQYVPDATWPNTLISVRVMFKEAHVLQIYKSKLNIQLPIKSSQLDLHSQVTVLLWCRNDLALSLENHKLLNTTTAKEHLFILSTWCWVDVQTYLTNC